MHEVLQYSLLLRALLTPLLYLTRTNVLLTAFLLTLLDVIDCNPLVMKLLPEKDKIAGCSGNTTYQILDKSLDLIQYITAIILLKPVLPSNIFITLLFLVIYRIIGIFVFLTNNNPKTFILFFEFIKEYMVLSYIFKGNIPIFILIPAMLLKILYEYLMHDKHIFLDIYKVIFE